MGEGKVLDLFCGSGGFSEGFKKAGFDILLGIDYNKDALMTFSYNHGLAKIICDDIKNIEIEKVGEKLIIKSMSDLCQIHEFGTDIDIIIGGVPCKASSSQSNGKHKAATREKYSDLYKEYIRFVNIINPKVFIIENVPEFLTDTDNDGNIIYDEINNELGLNGSGYNIKSYTINIADYGVPQTRERLIIIGNKIGNIKFPDKLLSEDNWITVENAILDLPKYTATPEQCKKSNCHVSEYKIEYTDISIYQSLMRNKVRYIFNHITPKNKIDSIQKIDMIPSGGNWKDLPYKLISSKNVMEKINNFSNLYYRLEKDKPARTIVHIGKNYIIHPVYNRLLSVREGARLQGFDDTYIFKGGLTSQYQQIADAISPIFTKCLAEEIKEYININKES